MVQSYSSIYTSTTWKNSIYLRTIIISKACYARTILSTDLESVYSIKSSKGFWNSSRLQPKCGQDKLILSCVNLKQLIQMHSKIVGGVSRCVMAKLVDCDLQVSEFEPQSRCYVYFRTNTLGKDINPLIYPLWVK